MQYVQKDLSIHALCVYHYNWTRLLVHLVCKPGTLKNIRYATSKEKYLQIKMNYVKFCEGKILSMTVIKNREEEREEHILFTKI